MRAVHDQKTYLGCTGQDPQGHLSVRVDLRTNVSPTVAPRKVMNHTLAIVLTTVLKVLSGWRYVELMVSICETAVLIPPTTPTACCATGGTSIAELSSCWATAILV